MARRVFFSFHYDRDVRRVVQVRNSWVVPAQREAQPFYDKAAFEEAKRRAGGIEKWIEEQMKNTTVTVVLFGKETWTREWVLHELRRSHELKKGILAIDIHNVKDPQSGTDAQGDNPLAYVPMRQNGAVTTLYHLHRTYDWIRNDGRNSMPDWIETAARAAGR